MILVTQSFGNEQEYARAVFCIASYYAHCADKNRSCYLFTDNPEYFKQYLGDFAIRYFLLTHDKIKEMRGEIDFLHRMKIALIDEAFQSTDGDLLYVDSDTFFLKDPIEKMNQVSEAVSFMHLPEYSFDSMRVWRLPAGVPFRAFIDHISHNLFKMPDGSSLKVDTSKYSWNAGVMMFHSSHRKLIPEVFALTDQFYSHVKNHACEQYAFSIVMQHHTTVHRCDDVSYHYWYREKKKLADIYVQQEVKRLFTVPVSVSLDRIRRVTRELPKRIENDVAFLKDAAVQSFNEDEFSKGYRFALRVLLKDPLNIQFIRDVLYHVKRSLVVKK